MGLSRLDDLAGLAAEGAARRTARRSFLSRSLTAMAGVAVGLAFGSLKPAPVAAAGCQCVFSCGSCTACQSRTCPGTPGACPPAAGGQAACKACKTSDGICNCQYPNGQWSTPSGCCGTNGLYVCVDCRCPATGDPNGCSHRCYCRSYCVCPGCRTPEDEIAEMERILREVEAVRV